MTDPIKSSAMQEDLLLLLCFYDEQCRIIHGVAEPGFFDPVYSKIAERVFRHIDKNKKSPGAALHDIVDDLVNSEDKYTAKTTSRILGDLFANKDNVNIEHTMRRFESFIRERRMHGAIMEAAAILQNAAPQDDEAMDEADKILDAARRDRLALFDSGTFLNDPKRALQFLHHDHNDVLPTGLASLDARAAGPVRGGLHLFIAPPKHGKSWWLIHLGKVALIHRLNVIHITLEMDEARVAGRYLQAIHAVGKRENTSDVTRFELNQVGQFVGINRRGARNKLHLNMSDIEDELRNRINRRSARIGGIAIKQFPTGSLTIANLEAYIDMLADKENIRPDLLIIDYADLMRVDGRRDYRVALGQLYKDLRGIAVERGIAVATATQANRGSLSRGRVTEADVSEDFSKIATADAVLTYARTEAEKLFNLARVYVAAGRNDEDKFTVVVSQHYDTGQFALQSARMNSSYRTVLDTEAGNTQNEASNED